VVDKAELSRIHATVAMVPDNRKLPRKYWSRFQQALIPVPVSVFLIKEKAATVEVPLETSTYGYMWNHMIFLNGMATYSIAKSRYQ
jgi:hypothetical protein